MYIINARPEVAVFAEQMERCLQQNEGNGGWTQREVEHLLEGAEDNLSGVYQAIEDCRRDSLLESAANLANYAMMIADKFGSMNQLKVEFEEGDDDLSWGDESDGYPSWLDESDDDLSWGDEGDDLPFDSDDEDDVASLGYEW